jgi:cell division protein FtsB
MTTIAPTLTNVERLLADIDRLARVNQQLRTRIQNLELVEQAAHRLLSTKPAIERDARERLLAAIKRAEGVAA